jgi:hypothetical protein
MMSIFADGFESGNLSAWTGTSATPPAAGTGSKHDGSYGVSAQIDSARYVYKTLAGTSRRLSVEFWFRPYYIFLWPATNDTWGIFNVCDAAGTDRLVEVYAQITTVVNQTTSKWKLGLRTRTDANAFTNTLGAMSGVVGTSWVLVRLEVILASAAGANDGRVRLYADNVLVAEVTGIDNDAADIGRVYVESRNIVGASVTAFFWDTFDVNHLGAPGAIAFALLQGANA